MDLTQVRAFLVLADELHFGRAAERVGLSQPRVSRLVSALEREVGGPLFDRTTRRVRLTPLGTRLRDGWRPAYGQLLAALDDARTAARQPAGTLRIGFTLTTGGSALTRLVRAFTAAYPGCDVQLREIRLPDLYDALRRDDIDILISWLVVDEPDLTAGPAIEHRARALAVSRDHPLAGAGSVSAEDLADYETASAPRLAVYDAIVPPRTPSGRPVRRTHAVTGLHETLALVASGQIVHPTVAGLPLAQRGDIILLPLTGLPPLPLGPIWCTAHENARIRALADVAATLPRRTLRAAAHLIDQGVTADPVPVAEFAQLLAIDLLGQDPQRVVSRLAETQATQRVNHPLPAVRHRHHLKPVRGEMPGRGLT